MINLYNASDLKDLKNIFSNEEFKEALVKSFNEFLTEPDDFVNSTVGNLNADKLISKKLTAENTVTI